MGHRGPSVAEKESCDRGGGSHMLVSIYIACDVTRVRLPFDIQESSFALAKVYLDDTVMRPTRVTIVPTRCICTWPKIISFGAG